MGFLSPASFDFIAGFNPLIIVVFGGLGSMTGTIAAAFGWIFFLEGFLRVLLGPDGHRRPDLALRALPDRPAPPHARQAPGPPGHRGVGLLQGQGDARRAKGTRAVGIRAEGAKAGD